MSMKKLAEYQTERSKIGTFMYNLTYKLSKFLIRHMWLYYLLSYTWGILMTLAGWVSLGVMKLFTLKKSKFGKFGPAHYLMFGNNWGGLEFGINFFVANNMGDEWTLHTKKHELGHTFQNAIYGPFVIFISFIPSAIRYWYQHFRAKKNKSNKPYDLAWFEESATDVGYLYNYEKLLAALKQKNYIVSDNNTVMDVKS